MCTFILESCLLVSIFCVAAAERKVFADERAGNF